MKRIIFSTFSVLSILSYFFAGLLLYIYFTEESPGMIMIFLIPLLVSGLLCGISGVAVKIIKDIELSKFLLWLYYLNLILMILGVIALIYSISQ